MGPAAARLPQLIGSVLGRARPIAPALLDFVFPPGCMACGRTSTAHDGLCPACWRGVSFIERPVCERLGTPFVQDFGSPLLSPRALSDPPTYDRARGVARFEDGPVRVLLHRFKYGDRTELSRPLARWMARAGSDLLADAQVIVPIPLHRGRLWSRRFNQAALLARDLSRLSGVPADPFGLDRVRSTPSQVGMTRPQRIANVQGAFRMSEDARMRLQGRRALLIDDVLTTGATLDAAARALRRGGVTAVDVLVFGLVVPES